MPPTYSAGVRIIAVMTGSSMVAMLPASGSLDGLSISRTSPSVVVTRYSTPGAVVTRSMLNSRSSRSCTISMCSSPRNPHRKPKPSAADVSGSKKNDASFSRSFSSASRSSGYWCPSTGYSPANTIGLSSLNPGNGVSAGRLASVMVSPIFASPTFLMLATRKPTSPAASSPIGSGLGENTPTCSTSNSCPLAISRILVPAFRTPSITRATMTTPRYESYQESKISALSGAEASPAGGGRRWITASSTSAMPIPSLALVRMARGAVEPHNLLDLAPAPPPAGRPAGLSC